MILKFNKIKINNFMSFGPDVEINLQRNGYTLVKGINENEDDLATSNGSGKSSIWEAISWCLTGETIRGSKEVKNIYSDGTTSVSLLFNVGKIEYEITRTKNPSNLTLLINGEDKSAKGIRDTEKLLEEYLPDLTSSLIGSVIILGQGLPQRFTNNSPSGRKEVLEKLSKSDFMINDLKNRISTRLIELRTTIKSFEDSNLELNGKKTVLNQNLNAINIELDSFTNELKESLYVELNDINSKQNNLKVNESDLCAQGLDNEQSLAHYQKNLTELSDNIQSILFNIDEEYYGILSSKDTILNEINAQIKSLSDEIIKLDSIVDVCPTCGQKLLKVVKPDTTKQKEELQNLKNSYNKLSDEYQDLLKERDNKKLQASQEQQSKQKELTSKIDSLQVNGKQILQQLQTIRNELNELKIQASQVQFKIDNFEEQQTSLLSKVENVKKQINEIDDKLLYNNNELTKWNNHLDVVTKMNSIISRDFRGYLLTNVINFINNKAKEYSKEVFETDKIEFQLDGNNISISYDNKEYENLSGGEKQKVDIIVQFAIRDMLCHFLNFSSNILVLDEIFDNLDSIGCQKILNLVATKLKDVDSIYIVTHHNDISIPYDDELIIVKGANKISRVQ